MMSDRCDRHLVTLGTDGQCSRCLGRSTSPPWLREQTTSQSAGGLFTLAGSVEWVCEPVNMLSLVHRDDSGDLGAILHSGAGERESAGSPTRVGQPA
jgi:hypothetical protein